MQFIVLTKFRHKPIKQEINKMTAYYADLTKRGIKTTKIYWTLGRYDVVLMVEAPDERVAMKALLHCPMEIATETLVAVPREEAIKLLG